ncbi:peptide deformylase [Rhabdobacter roseus]|uniref:Peptide deformylase n=1 Tax=Rhabdobacter roseus TaxID=1655419 RepID=A0A840TSK4_9BACT|nr:peptide deformylase [Rhabdobacter roseus]MBB5286931.1 peptide deformylase [Rhabdobacter roseus]
MQLPILAYGHAMLRQKTQEVPAHYPGLDALIERMWITLYGANGCGLAAPQVNQPLRLFLVDSQSTYHQLADKDRQGYFAPDDTGLVETFINATIVERSAETWRDTEGCLSIPTLTATVERPWEITIEYFDRAFQKQQKTFAGATARMIQHEYDHTEGILYLDYLKPLKKQLLQNKLRKITAGQVPAKYPMQYVSDTLS